MSCQLSITHSLKVTKSVNKNEVKEVKGESEGNIGDPTLLRGRARAGRIRPRKI